jgi:Putative amidoligase enzyme
MVVTHNIQLNTNHRTPSLLTFKEHNGGHPLRMVKIDDAQKFGIELELSSPPGIDSRMIANMMPRSAGNVIVGGARHAVHTDGWKVVHDGSIACNRSMPACNKFELVSRILVGGAGLRQISDVTRALSNSQITINKSMGFHVHVDVSGYSVEQLIKSCQNFIKVCCVAM